MHFCLTGGFLAIETFLKDSHSLVKTKYSLITSKNEFKLSVIFSSTGLKPAELMPWRGFRRPSIR